MIATAEPQETTSQRVSTESPEWRKLLRRIVKDRGDKWTARASAPEWTLEFNRTVAGKLGEPDCNVRIGTDCRVYCPGSSQFGEKQSFHDSKPVLIPQPSRLFLHDFRTAVVAHLLLNGARLSISPSSGSTSSSFHGLSFVTLEAEFSQVSYASVEIGATAYVDGRRIITGPLD